MRIIIILIILIIPIFSNAATLYLGSGETYTNLQAAMAAMGSGDTLIIRDGTYTGASNVMDVNNRPPNGTANAYTTIKAENTAKAIFNGEGARIMCNPRGDDWNNHISYVCFEGLQWCYSSGDLVNVSFADHIKFIKCSIYETTGTGYIYNGFAVSYAEYVLFEDCWSFGSSNYNFVTDKDANYVIFRRCVARHDRYPLYSSQASFADYDGSYVEFQNCITIDGDQTAYCTGGDGNPFPFYAWMYRGVYAGSLASETFRGCISLNHQGYGVVGSTVPAGTNVNFIDCVITWDSQFGSRTRSDGANFNRCTVGEISSSDMFWGNGMAFEANQNHINNSIIYGVSTTYGIIGGDGSSNYNAFYGNGTNYSNASIGANDISSENSNAIDPIDGSPGNGVASLKFLTRIENGSDLDGAGSDGEDIGATIIKQIGKSGTLWGETGWNSLQDGTNGQENKNLWPFPNEDIIRENMRSYSYDNGELSGARGFCADGQTLTQYIWEYLGNSMPTGLYNNASIGSGATCKLGSGATVQIQ